MTRDEITAALAGVAGIDAQPTVPDSIVAYVAWPQWAGATPVETMACVIWQPRWQAYVALPEGTRADAIEASDVLLESVGSALFGAGLPIERVDPVRVQIAPGATDTIPALRFTLAD